VVDGEPRETLRIDAAMKMVQPGQTVRLVSGVYTEPVEIANKGVGFDRPIVIRGESGVTFDCRRNLVRPPHGEGIDRRHYAFVKILDSRGIVLENLTIENVWPTAVYIGQSSEIVLRRLNLHGGTYAVFARGERTRRIVAERCAWTGDTTLWDEVIWKDVHMPPYPRRELDGDFFRSVDIPGEVVIRHNMVQHVFNGVHLFASPGLDTMNRDVFSRDLQRELGQPYTRSRYYHLYINGYYWGIYQSQERPEEAYAETYFGATEADYDVVKVDADANHTIQATNGTLDLWQRVYALTVQGFASDANYHALEGRIPSVELTRMSVLVNGRVRSNRILNDALYAHRSPAATSRYILEHKRLREEHRSSGFWIAPYLVKAVETVRKL
jgi:hypothetical protein